jgi:hypothetical protein
MQRHALNIHSREISDINQKRSSSNSETSYPVDTERDGEKDTEANADADMLLLCGACPKNDTLEDEPVAGNDERSEEKSDAETSFNPTTNEENLHVWINVYTYMSSALLYAQVHTYTCSAYRLFPNLTAEEPGLIFAITCNVFKHLCPPRTYRWRHSIA